MIKEKIKALFVFEIMGRPAEHIKNTLDQLIDKIGSFNGINVIKKTVHEPKLVERENVKELFTTFGEVEIEFDNLDLVFDVVLHMLPAHVEIIEPEELRLKNFELSSTLSQLTIKLHKYDEIAKAALMERNILMRRLEEMQIKINTLEKGKKGNKNKSKLTAGKKPAKKSKKVKK